VTYDSPIADEETGLQQEMERLKTKLAAETKVTSSCPFHSLSLISLLLSR